MKLLPAGPLLAAIGDRKPETIILANRMPLSHQCVRNWRSEGGVTPESADAVCDALQMHPLEIYSIEEWQGQYGEYAEDPFYAGNPSPVEWRDPVEVTQPDMFEDNQKAAA